MIVSVVAVTFLSHWANHAADVVRLPDGATRSLQDWEEIYRPATLKRMQEVMGSLPAKQRSHPLNVKFSEEVDCGDYVRRFLSYESEPGSSVPAYLLIPKSVLAGMLEAFPSHTRGSTPFFAAEPKHVLSKPSAEVWSRI